MEVRNGECSRESIVELRGSTIVREEWVNGRITSTMLGIERGCIMTFYVTVEAQGSGQGLGGYVLAMDDKPGCREQGFKAILNLLNVVGVEKWEDLKGQLVRVKFGELGTSEPALIGNIMDYDKVWDVKKEMETQE